MSDGQVPLPTYNFYVSSIDCLISKSSWIICVNVGLSAASLDQHLFKSFAKFEGIDFGIFQRSKFFSNKLSTSSLDSFEKGSSPLVKISQTKHE